MEFFKEFKEGQKSFGDSIAALVNAILLSLVYFIGVGGTSIIAKIFGKHFLDMKINTQSQTYWRDLNLDKERLEEAYKQF